MSSAKGHTYSPHYDPKTHWTLLLSPPTHLYSRAPVPAGRNSLLTTDKYYDVTTVYAIQRGLPLPSNPTKRTQGTYPHKRNHVINHSSTYPNDPWCTCAPPVHQPQGSMGLGFTPPNRDFLRYNSFNRPPYHCRHAPHTQP